MTHRDTPLIELNQVGKVFVTDELNRNARSAIHRKVGGRPAEWPPSTK